MTILSDVIFVTLRIGIYLGGRGITGSVDYEIE